MVDDNDLTYFVTCANDWVFEVDVIFHVIPLRRRDRVRLVELCGRTKSRRKVVPPSGVLVSVPVNGLIRQQVLRSGRGSVGEGRRVSVAHGRVVEAGPQAVIKFRQINLLTFFKG
jgi:hypothetical protein